VDEAGLLACAMYVDLNPVRAAMIAEPEQAIHTSVYDRFHGERGEQIDSAAFDLVPVSTQAAGKELRETPVETLKQRRRAKRRNPTGRRIPRDGWLAPLKLNQQIESLQPQVHTAGVRASDKGFLQLGWNDYLSLHFFPFRGRVSMGSETIVLAGKLSPADNGEFKVQLKHEHSVDTGTTVLGKGGSMEPRIARNLLPP
jgi:hypothetical protein